MEGRTPKTIDFPAEKGQVYRYCLSEWTQEGMTAAYTFLYAVERSCKAPGVFRPVSQRSTTPPAGRGR